MSNKIKKIENQGITQIYNADNKLIAEVQEYAIGGKYEVQYFKNFEIRGYLMIEKKLFNSLTGAFKNAHEFCEG